MISGVTEAFARLRKALEEAGVRYAVGGSWASTALGDCTREVFPCDSDAIGFEV